VASGKTARSVASLTFWPSASVPSAGASQAKPA
jgi:hypothetical protein